MPVRKMRDGSLVLFALFFMLVCIAPSHAEVREGSTFVFMDEPIPPYTIGEEGEICERGLTKEIFDILFGKLELEYETSCPLGAGHR